MSFMYFGSLTTPFAELLQPFFSPPHHRIHLLIDSIISVEITVSDEIWKLHHTCRCERGKKREEGRKKKKKKECHNSREDLGIILLWPLNGILPSCLFLYLSFYHWKMMAVHHSSTQQWATTAVNHNTFISTINTTKKNTCPAGCVCADVWL